MIIAAFYAAKTIRDNAIPGRVETTDWVLAVGGIIFSTGFTSFGLFSKSTELVRSCCSCSFSVVCVSPAHEFEWVQFS